METEVYPIPSKAPHVELMLKVALFVKEHGSRDTLLVVYYGGHAMISESRQSVWKAFSSIQTLFEDGQSDVLILLDCSSGAASAGFPDGDNLVETICASSWGADAPDPGRYSFTNSLIEVLQEWRGRKFSATMLHAEILSRLKHPRPITINGKVFEARSTPVHFVQTSNFSAPSIEVSSMAPKRHEPGGSSHDRVENAPITVTMRTRGGK
ncbi:tyrosine-protein phosphatase non-receptor type 6 [Colletotrichum tofieldiae]|nr:tyrosine-protein phosphatase non-receptor type 6 [Colletotrichum tofieldiae]GKT78941.1 tyrosine-protein phosphatase non-receptor type 6 [Colletotrichum tofieldiae]GKT86761.1 tyrosine-protein phosphatase non-receptor type 6 [Colletotrichum tofieldiae]